jgi:hypothetical protein
MTPNISPPPPKVGVHSPRHPERRAGGCEGAKGSQNAKTVAWPCFFRSLIAVGTPVARCPPHRPGRAGLPHPVPTLSFGVEALLLLDAPSRGHLTRSPGSVSGTWRSLLGSSWLPAFPPLGPQLLQLSPPLPCSPASQVLRRHVTSRGRSSWDHGLSLPLTARSCFLGRPRDLSVLARGVSRVHALVLRPRQTLWTLALSSPSVLPSARIHDVGIWERCFRGSITSACTPPANASASPHDYAA